MNILIEQAARAAVAEENTKEQEKESTAVEGQEVRMALENDGVMVNAQVKQPVPKMQISEKCQGAEEEVFVCFGRVVLTGQIDGFVMLSKAEVVMKVEGWEANGSVLVTAMTLVLEAEVEAAAVAMVAVAVVERLKGTRAAMLMMT